MDISVKNPNQLRNRLDRDEGVRPFVYTDTTGNLTVGVGHNLTVKGVSIPVIDLMYEEDIRDAIVVLDHILPSWRALDEVRQIVFLSLAFNMGYRLAGFKNMLRNTNQGLWRAASSDLQASLWFRQVGYRGPRLVGMLRTGVYPID